MYSHIRMFNRLHISSMFSKHSSKGGSAVTWLLKTPRTGKIMPRQISMMALESSLPKLPVPPLQQTMEKYLKAVEAIVDKEQFKNTQEIVKEFRKPGGVGELLQNKLLQRAEEKDNWLFEYWNDAAYLKQRIPTPINFSPGRTYPKEDFKDNLSQLKCAARLITNTLKIKHEIENETLSVDMAGSEPLTMFSYKLIFSGDRIPGVNKDQFILAPKDLSKHILVAHRNQFFVFDVYDNTGKPLSESDLLSQLMQIVEKNEPSEHPVGVFTTSDRTFWANQRKVLCEDKENKESLDHISNALFVVSLDKPPVLPSHQPIVGMEDINHSMAGEQSLHGGGVENNTMNRWFDKTLNFCISEDGYVGCVYEHFPAEGPPVARVWDYVGANSGDYESITPSPSSNHLPSPLKLKWNLQDSSIEALETAKNQIQSAVDNLDLRCLTFDGYGKDFIKSQKLSPDAWLQISFQLAFYRLHGEIGPAYESCSLRKFYRARTDNIRSSSMPTLQFVQAMDDRSLSTADKREYMFKAIRAHTEYTKECLKGQGIDRHLLGLKMAAAELGMDVPDLFNDSTFDYCFYFKVSTSQMLAEGEGSYVVFGPGVPESYAMCYNPSHPDKISFCLSTYKNNPITNPEYYATSLRRSLDTMRLISTTSKL